MGLALETSDDDLKIIGTWSCINNLQYNVSCQEVKFL